MKTIQMLKRIMGWRETKQEVSYDRWGRRQKHNRNTWHMKTNNTWQAMKINCGKITEINLIGGGTETDIDK